MIGRCLICDVEVDTERVERDPATRKLRPPPLVQRFEGFEPIFYCSDHVGRAATRPTRARAAFRLTADERAAILAGDHPRLERPKAEDQVDVGHTVEVTSTVSIVITKKGTNRKQMVQYRYTVSDQRLDAPHLLRMNPPAHRSEHDEEDRLRPLTPALEAKAAEESAYTSSRLSAVPNEPEAIRDTQRRALAATSRLRRAESVDPDQAAEQFERQAKSFANEVRGLGRQCVRMGLDPGPKLAEFVEALKREMSDLEERDAA